MEKIISLVVSLALLVTLDRPARADGDKLEQARLHVKSGSELYDENNFKAALVEFQRAYELAPSYKLMFNIGQIEMELQNYAGALRAFTRYLKEGGPDVAPDRAAQVNAEIDRLKGRVGRVTVQTAAGAEVLVDDVSVGFAPLPDALVVNAGSHKFAVQVSGQPAASRTYDVAGRQELTVALGLELAVTPTDVKKPRVDDAPRSRTPVYVAWGVTGAFALGSIVFGILAYRDSNELESLRDSFPVTQAQLDDQRSKTRRDAAIADGLLGATVVSAAIATYFTLTRREAKRETRSVQLRPTLGGVAVGGSF